MEQLLTPKDFADKMRELDQNDNVETKHILADNLIIKLLVQLGYQDGAKVFQDMAKWYS